MIDVTTMTFDTTNSRRGSCLGLTTLAAFAEPAMDGKEL